MPALGEEFRSARESRGLSLSDVAERLHIRSVYLAAIEEEDWSSIGAPVYVRGFMRTYARFLGLNAEAAVARFAEAVPVLPPAAAARAAGPPPGEERASDRRRPSPAAIFGMLVAVVLLGFVGYEYYQYRAEKSPAAPLAKASAAAAASAAPAALASAPAPEPATKATQAAKAVPQRGLSIRVTQRSWLRVSVDGTVRVEGIFTAGTIKSFTGKSADVRVGNAGGVRIAVNGKELGPLGGDGDVVERQFALGGE